MAKTPATSVSAPGSIEVDATESAGAVRSARLRYVLKNAMWELWKSRLAFVGAMIVFLLVLVAILAPAIARYDPVEQDYRDMLQGPSMMHFFGTDKFGRDIWSRVVWGGQRALTISIIAVILGIMGGVPLGAISGYYGGKLDAVLMRIVDAWLAFPGILLYLLGASLIYAYKLSLFWSTVGLIIILGLAQVPSLARLVRGLVLAEREREYVEASQIIGESPMYISFRQILPNCISPVIVQSTISLGFVMLIIAGLSFLGLGAPPPTPDWGADLNLAREHMEYLPYLAMFPGLAISFAVLGFNLFGDGLRDILDPRLVDN